MPYECAAGDCKQIRCKESNYSFHHFPLKEPVRLKQWLININRMDPNTRKLWKPKKHDSICSKHFEDWCFTMRTHISRQENMPFKSELLPDAVPTLFQHNEKARKRAVEAEKRRSAFHKRKGRSEMLHQILYPSEAESTLPDATQLPVPEMDMDVTEDEAHQSVCMQTEKPPLPSIGIQFQAGIKLVLSEILDSVSQPQVKPSSSPSEIEKTSCSGPLLVGSLAGTADTHVGLQSLVSTTKKRVWTGRKVLMPDTEDGAISTRSQQKEKCCVKHCSSNKQSAVDNSKTKTFFPFPREEARCRQWAKNCGRPELIQKSAIQLRLEGWRLCSDHFDSSQFQFSSHSKKRLTPDAVPTPVFKPQPRVKSKKSKAKKSTTGHKRPRLTEAEEEPLPEVKLEMDYAEDPTLGWVSGSLGAESADTEPLGMATQPQNVGWEPLDIKLEPQNVDWEPLDIKLEPPDFKLEPQNVVCEPLGFESKPQVCASEPADIKTEAQEFYWEPLEIKREPQDTECSPVQVSSVVLSEDPQVTDIKPEPVFFEDPRLGCGSGAHSRFDRGQHQESPSVIPSAVRQHSPSVTPSAVRQQSPSVTPSVIPTELTLAYYNCQRWMESFDSQFDNSDVEDDN